MGRRSLTGGIKPPGKNPHPVRHPHRGFRYRPSPRWIHHETNLRRAREHLVQVKARIEAGRFLFSEAFPDCARRLGRYSLRLVDSSAH